MSAPAPEQLPIGTVTAYLAGRYSRREELCEYRDVLQAAGFVVTSRWLNGSHQVDERGLSDEADPPERERFAAEDWADLLAAGVVVNFTEPPRSTSSRGGRHVEFGAALALKRRCLVVGPRENVFHCLPTVDVFPTWRAAFDVLQPLTFRCLRWLDSGARCLLPAGHVLSPIFADSLHDDGTVGRTRPLAVPRDAEPVR